MNSDKQPLLLASSWSNNLPQPAFVMLFLGLGAALAALDRDLGLWVCVLSGLVIIVWIFRRFSKSSRLILSPGGFSLTQASRVSSFKWSEIEAFYISRGPFSRALCFSLSVSGENRLKPSIRPDNTKSNHSKNERKLPDDYGLGVKGLKALMEEWQRQFTRRPVSPRYSD